MAPGVATLLTPVRTVAREISLRGGSGRRARRVWSGHGRAHLEVRGADHAERDRLRDDIVAELGRLRGVHAAEINAVLGRVVVAFDDEQVGLDGIVEVVEGVEEAHGLAAERFPADRAEHPGDREPLDRQLVALGADLLGVGAGTLLKAARSAPLSSEVASVLALVDASPRLRRELANLVGRSTTDVGLALATAMAQGLAQGPTGLVADAVHRAVLAREVMARRAVWHRREPELHEEHGHRAQTHLVEPRPVAMPSGPVELQADRAAVAGLVASATALVVTRDWRPAVTALAASTPRAARLGREAFGAHLGVVLAGRDIIPMDGDALRRLDRVDTVVLDADTLVDAGWTETSVLPLDGRLRADLATRARRLLADPAALASAGVTRGHWSLEPLRGADRDDSTIRDAARSAHRPGCRQLLLRRDATAVAVVTAERAIDPLAEALVATARMAGDVVVAGTSYGVAQRLHVARTTAGGTALRRSVRDLQAAGHVVLLVSARSGAALAASDCGVGLLRRGEPVPWGAHLVCGPGLGPVVRVLAAVPLAARASEAGRTLALYGSGVGSILALAGPRQGAAARAMLGVNAASLVAVGTGLVLAREVGRRPEPAAASRVPWHEMEREVALARLGTGDDGLPEKEALARERRRPSDEGQRPPTVVGATLEELVNPLTPALAGGAGLSAVGGSLTDAVLIGGVMVGNAVLGGVQRVGAHRALRRLVDVSAVQVRVRRGGAEATLTSDRLVEGDVVVLEAGEVVPADARIIEARGLEVDESGLTGESLPTRKTAAPVATPVVAERHSMLYEGTSVAAGHAVAVVVATGSATEVGRAARASAGPRRPGGVQARLRRMTTATVPLALGAGAGLVGTGLLRGTPLNRSLGTAVSLAVAAVPEGLPTVATLAQLSAAKRLSKRGALVRTSSTVETLGRVDVLCFDKTGTLTEGRMRLHSVWDAAGTGDPDPAGEVARGGRSVLSAGLRATPVAAPRARLPHPTDRAVARAAGETGAVRARDGRRWSLVAELPFESGRGYHAVVGEDDDGLTLSVKGAPEIVLPRCTRVRTDDRGGTAPLDDAGRARVADQVDRLARTGRRVLAVAERTATDRGDLEDDRVARLVLVGLLALSDPVRASAAEAVRGVRAAGVRVVMLTGDHPSTAESIAAELGLLDGEVVTGAELDEMDDEALAQTLGRCSVFARVSPGHKVRVVRVLQQAGRVVAVTGDGANDAPAIRLADVGVALGLRGTNAAKEAADLVVTDDALETIIAAIVEGRATWASVRDAVAVLLGGNLGEVAFVLGAGLLPGGSPLNARQLLLVNLLTDLLPSTALAMRPPRTRSPEDLLREGPDASLGSALLQDVLVRGALTAGAAGGGWAAARMTGTAGRASTVALVSLVGAQLGQTAVLGLRSPLVAGASLASAAVLAGVVQTPGVSHFFGCRPLGPVGWTIGLTAAGSATAAAVAGPPVVRWVVGARHATRPAGAAEPPPGRAAEEQQPDLPPTLPAPRTPVEPVGQPI